MELSDEEKAKIDYLVKKQREDKNEQLEMWVNAAFKVLIVVSIFWILIKIFE